MSELFDPTTLRAMVVKDVIEEILESRPEVLRAFMEVVAERLSQKPDA